MKNRLFIIAIVSLFSIKMTAQSGIQFPKTDTTSVAEIYPYSLPIWGQKLTDRNIRFQLPYGINTNYVFNRMELEMTEFSLDLSGIPLDMINEESLGFQPIVAKSSGLNVRADVWILPFLNFYGIYAENNGSTAVTMDPFNTGVIKLDPVSFRSQSFGGGTTFIYGWNNYFVSIDANYTSSQSNILEDRIGFIVASARVGRRVEFSNGMALAVYVGAMYRDFTGKKGNRGNVLLEEYVPGLTDAIVVGIDLKTASNNVKIANPFYPKDPETQPSKDELREQNDKLAYNRDLLTDSPDGAQVNYFMKKEIIQPWSTQVGFNWEITPNWMLRGELGYSSGQTFLMTGLQYRFGL